MSAEQVMKSKKKVKNCVKKMNASATDGAASHSSENNRPTQTGPGVSCSPERPATVAAEELRPAAAAPPKVRGVGTRER